MLWSKLSAVLAPALVAAAGSVTFDDHSLKINGTRELVFSGEFHPWRLPNPELWRDVLEKMKAAGQNTISIYHNWNLNAPTNGTLDFDYHRDYEKFYEICQEVGMFVFARPGPYINGETYGGGFPSWTSTLDGLARSAANPAWRGSYKPYIEAMAEQISRYQVTDGKGPIILLQVENEFTPSDDHNAYMQELEDIFRQYGVTVPTTSNQAGTTTNGEFLEGDGSVDIFGYDRYPMGFDCSHPTKWSEVPDFYLDYHEGLTPTEPNFIPEFQGGAFDPWGGPGYDSCGSMTNSSFTSVFYKNNWAAEVTMFNVYMMFGGTNWGNLFEPTVYSSYDYGAPISEDRTIGDKYAEIKLQGLFLRGSPSFLTASRVSQGNTTELVDTEDVFVTNLANENGTNYYFLRHSRVDTSITTEFKINANTTAGLITIPQSDNIALQGRDAKTLVTNYPFGSSSTLGYSTAEVLTHLTVDGKDWLVVYAPSGQDTETLISGVHGKAKTSSKDIKTKDTKNGLLINAKTNGIQTVRLGKQVIVIADKESAKKFWQPILAGEGAYGNFPKYADGSVLVYGPDLVRNASIEGSTLKIIGDVSQKTTPLTIVASKSIKHVTFNGEKVDVKNDGEFISGRISVKDFATFDSLKFPKWKTANSLPELSNDFDDSEWVICNHTSSTNPNPATGGKNILFADDYGYHRGNILYRGHFNGNSPANLSMTVSGGFGFPYSVWLNEKFLGFGQGDSETFEVTSSYELSADDLNEDENIVLVVMGHSGMSEDNGNGDGYRQIRGIRGYNFTDDGGSDLDITWKIQGNYGGQGTADNVRGVMNEGGLYAERAAWTWPGYDDSKWKDADDVSISSDGGIQVFRTTFDLDLPSGYDIPLAINFTIPDDTHYEMQLYVNGWMYGKASNLGPQHSFPVPQGILNYNGENTLAVTLWSVDNGAVSFPDLQLVANAIIKSGISVGNGTVYSPQYTARPGYE